MMGTNFSRELEPSADGKWLAWASWLCKGNYGGGFHPTALSLFGIRWQRDADVNRLWSQRLSGV